MQKRFLQEYDSLRKEYLSHVDKDIDEYLSVFTVTEAFSSISRHWYPYNDGSKNDKIVIVQNANYGTEIKLFMNLLRSGIDFPRYKTDTWGDFKLYVALLHMAQSLDSSNLNDFFDLLKMQVKKGNIHPFDYSTLYDEYYWRKHGPTYYTISLTVANPEDLANYEVGDVYEIESIDERREEIYLPPLWVWCKTYNIPLPEKYKYNKL